MVLRVLLMFESNCKIFVTKITFTCSKWTIETLQKAVICKSKSKAAKTGELNQKLNDMNE